MKSPNRERDLRGYRDYQPSIPDSTATEKEIVLSQNIHTCLTQTTFLQAQAPFSRAWLKGTARQLIHSNGMSRGPSLSKSRHGLEVDSGWGSRLHA
jgi:hypothetical protein